MANDRIAPIPLVRIYAAFTTMPDRLLGGRKGWFGVLVDALRLRALREEVGEDGFDEVLALFLVESEEAVERLSRHGVGDVPAAELHFLKGIALNLGFDDLAALCRKGERGEGFDPLALRTIYGEARLLLEAMMESVD